MPVLVFFLLPFAAFAGTAIYFLLRFARAFERRNASVTDHSSTASRIARLEEQVELQRAEIQRLSDGLAFTEQLVSKRPPLQLDGE